MTKEPLTAAFDRELTEIDIGSLDAPRETKAPTVQKLRERHHRLARFLAEGKSEGEAAFLCGYEVVRVSILKQDPAFQELVTQYQAQVDVQYRELHSRLSELAVNATEILNERLEEEPEKFDVSDLIKVAQLGADRTGYGPSSTQKMDVTVGFAQRLDAARARLIALRGPLTAEDAEVLDD